MPESKQLENRLIDKNELPDLLIATNWLEASIEAVVVMPENISNRCRLWLENEASKQAILMPGQYLFYPKIIDNKKIKTARV